jgi:hypothetical protein
MHYKYLAFAKGRIVVLHDISIKNCRQSLEAFFLQANYTRL